MKLSFIEWYVLGTVGGTAIGMLAVNVLLLLQ